MLEAGVAAMPEASGAFPQVSGLCFTYDIEAEPGNRVTGAVRQAADGTCSGEAIDLSEAATYTIATNDFTASGGDNYPPSSPAPTRATSWHRSSPRMSPGSRHCHCRASRSIQRSRAGSSVKGRVVQRRRAGSGQ